MRSWMHTRTFVFSVALLSHVLVAWMYYGQISRAYYLPYMVFILAGVLVFTLLKSGVVFNTILLGIVLGIAGGVEQWLAVQRGMSKDFQGIEAAMMLAYVETFIAIIFETIGIYAVVLVRKLWHARRV